MVSHKSSAPQVGSVPVRRNGRERVSAILDAATALFGNKGFDATTMSEIASQSKTAAGSLYRFFPTKEAVGDAIVARYVERFEIAFAGLVEAAGQLSATDISRFAFDAILQLENDHAAAISVADAGGVTREQRQSQTNRVLDIIAQLISHAFPIVAPARVPVCAFTLMQLFKTVTVASKIQAPQSHGAIDEMRLAIELYLRSLG
ncbi:MAG TPA: TetR/AcrR family transcriptional regulator [Rhodopila sp.]|jgi:AcrR family transcriptional regulator